MRVAPSRAQPPSPKTDNAMIDRLIEDRFRVTELVARRGPVMIFDAVDLDSGQRVVAKQLRGPVASDPDFIENWQHQLRSVQALASPNVPLVLTFSAAGDELLQVETPPPGVSLRHSIAGRGVLPLQEALTLIEAIAGALVPAHRSGVSHGALNPSSIFITEGPEGGVSVCITDWELGEIATAASETPHALPDDIARYLAPEQLGAAAVPPTPTADVYALGLILYEFLTSDHPFGVATSDPVLARLTHVPLAPSRYNPDIPPAVERVLLRALSRDPAGRPPHAGALVTALRQATVTPAVSPTRPAAVVPVVERSPERAPVRPTWALPALIGAIFLVLCLFSAVLVQFARRLAAPGTPPAAVATVPDVTGLPFEAAQQVVERENFSLVIAGVQSGSGRPPNTVLAQQPPAGALAPATRVISVTLALEPTPVALATVPNLYAQRLDVAEALLTQAGLRLGAMREAHDLTVPSGLIIEQNPRAGLQVPTGTPVDVIVSLGLPPDIISPGAQVMPEPAPAATPTIAQVFFPTVTPAPTITPPLPAPTEVGPPTPGPEAPGPLLFQDDFSTNNAGWLTADTVEYRGQVVDGRYRIVIFTPDTIWWTQSGREFTDFRYEADVIWAEQQEAEQGLGLVLRLQDARHFYFFEIDQFGNYRIRARDGDEWRTLLNWSLSSALRAGLGTNRLAVEAVGENLRFEANGDLLFQTHDGAYLGGDIGLAASNEGASTLTGEFDNVRVTGR